jgi:uncharacterized protein YaeQ
VVILAYGGRAAELWWRQNQNAFERHDRLSVMYLPTELSTHLVRLCQRTMRLNCTMQDGQVWLGDDALRLEVTPQFWKKADSDQA